jgi:hypothetical protein
VLIGAVRDVAKLGLYGSADLALVNDYRDRLASRKASTAQNSIGVGGAPVPFELDV